MATFEILRIDFEDYNTPNADLAGQGTAPYLWAVTNSVGGAPAADARIRTDDQGGASGIVMIRTTNNSQGTNNRAVAVMKSGIPDIGVDTVTKHILQADFSVDKLDANPSKNDILIRPSGANYDSGYNGWRAGIWVRTGEPNDRIVLQRLINSANVEVYTHYIPKVAYSGLITIQVTDDGSTLEVYANVSGTLELIHSVASTDFNDHSASGAIAFGREGGTQNTMVDNFVISLSSGIEGTPASGTIGGYLPAIEALVYCNDEEVQGCWKLDEASDTATRADSSNRGNHLDVILGNPVQITGYRDNGTRFVHWTDPFPSLQRTGSGVSEGMSPLTEDWSIGGWIRPSGSVLESYAAIFGKGGFDEYVLYLDDQLQLWGQVKIDGIGYIVTTTPSSVVLDTWQHLDWVVSRASGMQYLYHTDANCVTTLIGSGTIPGTSKSQDAGSGPIHMGTLPNGQNPLDADMDEWFFIQKALLTSEINSICELGLPSRDLNDASGTIGGYLDVVESTTAESGTIGGYMQAVATAISGTIGGYLEQTSVPSGASGTIGGYLLYNADSQSGTIGGLLYAIPVPQSGTIGGYIEGFTDTSGTYLSYFDFQNGTTSDFDAVISVGARTSQDFDAILSVARTFTPPTVTCYITNSGTPGGLHHITFSGTVAVGDTTLPNGGDNSINSAWIQFGDLSGVQGLSLSDNGFFEGSHTFTASGVYIVRVDVIDENGVHGSCSKRVDLSVGLPANEIITIHLSGVPQSGQVPLTVAFTNTFAVQPVGIKEQVINFGDRTITHLDNPVHLYKFVGNYIPVWIVKDDNGRFWNDSLTVGVNQ